VILVFNQPFIIDGSFKFEWENPAEYFYILAMVMDIFVTVLYAMETSSSLLFMLPRDFNAIWKVVAIFMA